MVQVLHKEESEKTMNNTQQEAQADRIQSELDSSSPMIKGLIPDDLLAELFKWKREHDISIEALRNLEDILKNYF